MVVEQGAQAVHGQAVVRRDFQQRVAESPVDAEQGIELGRVALVDQVGLVEQQQRADAGVVGGDQVAVDQVGVRLGQRGEDDDDLVDVGRHRLEHAAHVRSAQFRAARQLGDDHADALVAGAPHHAVTGDQHRQVGAQVTAEYLAGQFALQRLDFDLHTEVGDHQAVLFRAEIAAFQLVHRARLALAGAGGAFFLDLFDAPALPAAQLAFGHDDSVCDSGGESSMGRGVATAC
ncbi:hypothetical protein D3C85_621330 [compost metagenome]